MKHEIIVDDADKAFLARRLCMANTGYIVYQWEGKVVQQHIVIMGLKQGNKHIVDLVNRCRTRNTRSNLRIVSSSQNNRNKKIKHTKSSVYQGVTWHALRKKWAARVTFKYKSKHLGLFAPEKVAPKAYNDYSKEHFPGHYVKNEI